MIGILLAEDHVVRAALVALLELESDMRIVAEVGRGDEVLTAAKRTRPDVAIIDIDLPGIDGLSAAAQVHAEVRQCRTLVLTALGGPGTLHRALESGASGFLSKETRHRWTWWLRFAACMPVGGCWIPNSRRSPGPRRRRDRSPPGN